MSQPSESQEESAELPEAIPVERETLRKVQVDMLDLPEAKVIEVALESAAEEEEEEYEEEQDEEDVEEEISSSSSSRGGSKLNRKALDSTNRGKHPSSRRFVRGILHPHPKKVALASFLAILVRVVALGCLVLLGLFLMDWVELWTAWFFLALPVTAFFYFVMAHQARCRVCGVKEFLPSGSLKHKRTHRFLFFGPIISTALHLLLFKWFRCMFCGTPIRIRK